MTPVFGKRGAMTGGVVEVTTGVVVEGGVPPPDVVGVVGGVADVAGIVGDDGLGDGVAFTIGGAVEGAVEGGVKGGANEGDAEGALKTVTLRP